MIRTVSFSLGLLVVIGSFVLANKFQKPKKPFPPPPPPKVLMIGDSLSVGGFGEAVREHLEKRVRAPERGIFRVVWVVAGELVAR